jgi:ribosomal protein L7/L12
MGKKDSDEKLAEKEAKARLKQEREAAKVAARQVSQQESEQARAASAQLKVDLARKEAERYGQMVIEEMFAGKVVRIYDKGYVRVSGVFLGKNEAIFELLKGISSSADVTKKTGLGRTAGFVVTGGLNTLLTSNKRGDMYLTIYTDRTTHMLHSDPPTERDMKAMHKLATVGRSILESSGAEQDSQPQAIPSESSAVGGTDTVEQLLKLAELHANGVLSDAEFETAKKRVLTSSSPTVSNTSHITPPVMRSHVEVVLISAERNQIDVIKTVREFTSFSLREAKDAVDHAPSTLRSNCEIYVAEELQMRLESLGATVELR